MIDNYDRKIRPPRWIIGQKKLWWAKHSSVRQSFTLIRKELAPCGQYHKLGYELYLGKNQRQLKIIWQ